jgi:UDP-glucose 4-epimerase
MNYLITGIAGFVGSSLARAILAADPGARITGVDNLSFGYRERLNDIADRVEFIEGDVVNIKKLLGKRQFDLIVHCAAIAPLPECQRDSHRAIVQNVAICGSVADYALASGSRNIVFFSSGAIYESTTEFPTSESTTIATSLVYPTTKHIAELYFQAMCRSHELNVTAIRLFNLYGPHQDYFRKQPPLIGYLLTCLLKNVEAVLFSSGTQSRDYVYIDDLLRLVMAIASNMKARPDGRHFSAVNAGSGHSISVNEIIARLESVSGLKLRVKRMPATQYWDKYPELFDKDIAIDRSIIEREVNKHTLANLEKVEREFDWSAKVDMTEGLRACLEHAKTIIKSD